MLRVSGNGYHEEEGHADAGVRTGQSRGRGRGGSSPKKCPRKGEMRNSGVNQTVCPERPQVHGMSWVTADLLDPLGLATESQQPGTPLSPGQAKVVGQRRWGPVVLPAGKSHTQLLSPNCSCAAGVLKFSSSDWCTQTLRPNTETWQQGVTEPSQQRPRRGHGQRKGQERGRALTLLGTRPHLE